MAPYQLMREFVFTVVEELKRPAISVAGRGYAGVESLNPFPRLFWLDREWRVHHLQVYPRCHDQVVRISNDIPDIGLEGLEQLTGWKGRKWADISPFELTIRPEELPKFAPWLPNFLQSRMIKDKTWAINPPETLLRFDGVDHPADSSYVWSRLAAETTDCISLSMIERLREVSAKEGKLG